MSAWEELVVNQLLRGEDYELLRGGSGQAVVEG